MAKHRTSTQVEFVVILIIATHCSCSTTIASEDAVSPNFVVIFIDDK